MPPERDPAWDHPMGGGWILACFPQRCNNYLCKCSKGMPAESVGRPVGAWGDGIAVPTKHPEQLTRSHLPEVVLPDSEYCFHCEHMMHAPSCLKDCWHGPFHLED